MTKVFVVLTAVLSIAVSSLFVAATAQWNNWRDLAYAYQTQANAELTHRMNLQARMALELAIRDDQVAGNARALADAQQNIQDITDQNARLKSDLARETQQALAFDAARTGLQEMLDVTMNENVGLRTHNRELQQDNTDVQARNTRQMSRIGELTAQLVTSNDEVRHLQERLYASEQQSAALQAGIAVAAPVEAPVGPARAVKPTVAQPIPGMVTEVDGSYASINIGETSGVTSGMTFMVYRDDSGYLGDLVIDTVHPKEAGGKLVSLAAGAMVRAGDKVDLPGAGR